MILADQQRHDNRERDRLLDRRMLLQLPSEMKENAASYKEEFRDRKPSYTIFVHKKEKSKNMNIVSRIEELSIHNHTYESRDDGSSAFK